MGSFRLILKNLTAIFTSNVISIVIELAQQPVLLHSYGISGFAAWQVLSSAVSYLAQLNFGLQTFVNQDLAVRYNRGERESFHVQQSTALRVLLGIWIVAAVGCLVIFVLPIEKILRLNVGDGSHAMLMPHWNASLTLYFIALQILTSSMLFGYFGGAFMGVGLAHRGNNWNNVQRFLTSVLIVALALLREPFYVLAVGQWVLQMVLLLGLLGDLKRKAPDIFPTLKYWDRQALKGMAGPSAHFMLLFGSNYIAWELPLILLSRFAGALPVAIFTLGRKIFSSGRQLLTGLTQSIGPEITRIYGQENWERMSRLYDYSERVIFFLVAVVNVPLFVFSPFLLTLWMMRSHLSGELFDLNSYLLLAATAIAVCVKEHKMQFQTSTNQHMQFARVTFFTYVGMTVVAVPAIVRWGLPGFLGTWFAAEVVQATSAVRHNRVLFAAHEQLSMGYLVRLVGLSAAGLVAGYVLLRRELMGGWVLGRRLEFDVLELAVMAVVAWYAFGMSNLLVFLKEKVQAKLRPAG